MNSLHFIYSPPKNQKMILILKVINKLEFLLQSFSKILHLEKWEFLFFQKLNSKIVLQKA
jgi:hypothetical protein